MVFNKCIKRKIQNRQRNGRPLSRHRSEQVKEVKMAKKVQTNRSVAVGQIMQVDAYMN